jgi:tRNA G18 (ribose-2'-O)-methylase SpoU
MDTYNIGTMFRLADALSVEKIYLCAGTLTPPNTRIKRASINTWQWANWEYKKTTMSAIKDLKKNVPNIKIVSIEQADNSIPYDSYDYETPIALVVGNETRGVNPKVLKKSDAIVEIPMHGINTSLNVSLALSIVSYKAMENIKKS